jgi:N-acetylglucosaminyldiphosphoundecaprenol N-acetyl-beta-D-mannosaminyltransferase
MYLLDYYINTILPIWPVDKKIIINTINPHCYCIAKKDALYKKALQRSDILIPDGFGIVLAANLLYGQIIPRIAGSDIHKHLLEIAQKKNLKVFYLGAEEVALQKISERISLEYPSVKVATYSPPFKQEFSAADNQKIIDTINHFIPDVLFVGMTAPKQEKWVFQNIHKLNAHIICSIGAVFDFYAGTIKRPGNFWIKIGLEWLPRLIKEPRRLWRRTFISTPLFLWYVLSEKTRIVLKSLKND